MLKIEELNEACNNDKGGYPAAAQWGVIKQGVLADVRGMERRAPAGQGQQRAGSMLPPIPRLPNPPLTAGTNTTSQSQRAAACTVQPWQQPQRPPLNTPPQQAGMPSLGSSARDDIVGSRPVTPPLRPAAPSQPLQHRVTAGQSSPSSQRLVAQGATCPLPSADDAMVGGREVPVEIAPNGLPYLPMQLGSPATPEERGEKLLQASEATADRVQAQAAHVVARQQLDAPGSANTDAAASAAAAAAKQAKKRPLRMPPQPEPVAGRAANKGLRHFSMKVCEKVESKGRTTYNEVADELVRDFATPPEPGSPTGVAFDEKNIRRRVYDALNVLMAISVIRKEKKNIQWCGLAAGLAGPACEAARAERTRIRAHLQQQHAFLQELLSQHRALQSLIARNRDAPVEAVQAAVAACGGPTPLQLPFIIIQAGHEAQVELQLSDDSTEVHFDFHNTPFKIHGDDTLLKLMDLSVKPSPLAPLGSRPASGKRRRSSPAPLEARSAAGMSSLPLAPRGAVDVLMTSPSIILSPIRVPTAGLGPPRGSTGCRLGAGLPPPPGSAASRPADSAGVQTHALGCGLSTPTLSALWNSADTPCSAFMAALLQAPGSTPQQPPQQAASTASGR